MTEQPLGIGGSDIDPTEEESALSQEQPKQPETSTNNYSASERLVNEGAVAVRDWIDNTFQDDQRSKDEIRKDREAITPSLKDRTAAKKEFLENDKSVAGETVRAAVGGVAGSIENLGEAGEFLGDTAKSLIAKTGVIKVDSKDIPWSQSYESAQWDLGTAKNNTAVGNFGREMISIVINMKQLAGLGVGVGGGATWQSRLASETLRGSLVDFLADPGEGNLSNIVADSRYSNLLSKALAHEDDDNQYIRRLKNLVEGGTIGIAVDGLSELYGALRAGKGAVKNGASAEEGADVAVKTLNLYHGTSVKASRSILEKGFKAGEAAKREQGLMMGDGVYMSTRPDKASAYGGNVLSGQLPKGVKILDLSNTDVASWAKDIGIGEPTKQLAPIETRFGTFERKFKYFSDEQKEKIRQYVLENGYAGVKYDPNLTPRTDSFGDPMPEKFKDTSEVVIYDYDTANKIVKSKAASIDLPTREIDETIELQPDNKIDFETEEETAARGKELWEQAKIKAGVPKEWNQTTNKIEERFEKEIQKLPVFAQIPGNGYAAKKQILPNGMEVIWSFTPDPLAKYVDGDSFKDLFGHTPLEVTWSNYTTSIQFNGHGKKLISFFNDIARKELKAGTVIYNQPVDLVDSAVQKSKLKQNIKAKKQPIIERYIDDAVKQELGSRKASQLMGELDGEWKSLDTKQIRKEFLEVWTNKDGKIDYEGLWEKVKTRAINDPNYADVDAIDNIRAETSVRASIYRRAGFGPVQDGSTQFAIVRGTPDEKGRWIQPLEGNPFNPEDGDGRAIREQIYEAQNQAEFANSQNYRKVENDLNSAKPGQKGKYEPYERGARRSTNDVNDAATSQAEKTDVDGGTQPFLNDADYDELGNVQDIAEYVEGIGAKINIDEIAGRLSEQPDDYVRKTLISVAKFASNGELSNLEDLRFVDDRGIRSFGAGGTVAMDVIVKDTAEQLLDLSEELIELNDLSHFARDKTLAFITRTRALVKIKKEASIQSSFQLQNWKQIPPDVQRSLDEANIMIDETFEKIEKAFKGGNAEDMLEQKEVIQQFARAMVSTGGDPTKIGSFWGMVYKTGLKNINQAVINAWLSSPVSQIRNLAGNTVVALERPLAMAIGHAMEGNWQGVRASASMLDSMHSTLGESLVMAKKSLGSETPVTKGSKLGEVFTNTTKDVDNLKRVATSPTEKFAAQTLGAYHSLVNMPWNTWPGRGLQSGDDLFKTMVSRMDLRYQAALEVDKLRDLPNFAGDEKAFNDAYEKLLKKKIGANGEILDKELIENAQEATFQKELKGKMKRVADSLNAHDEMKQFIPFIRTPHNVNIYAFQHIPGLARRIPEWEHTMRYGTPQQKAILKGREAMGYLLVGTAGTLAMTGNLTGNGPADPELKKLWLKDHAPNSIKFGNTWVSYKSIPGAELIFSAIADTGQIIKYLNPTDADKLWGQFVYTIANSITDRSYFQGFVDLAGLLDIKGWTAEKVTRATGERLNLVFPITGGAGFRNQFENVMKSGMYEYRNSLHAVMGKMTGGIVGDKIPTIDVLTGEQMVTGYENPINAISPFKIAKKTASPLAKELSTLQYEFSDAVIKKLHGVDLNIEEQQEIRKLMYDNGKFPKALNAYLKSSQFKAQYKNWVDNQGTIDSVDRKQSKWYKDISTIVGSYRRQASTKFLNSGSDIADNFKSRIGQSNNPLETLLKVR